MQSMYHVKKGDEIRVNSGNWKGANATVVAILKKKDRVVLEIPNMTPAQKDKVGKKTVKRTQQEQGKLIDRAISVHVSNVVLVKKFQREVNKDA